MARLILSNQGGGKQGYLLEANRRRLIQVKHMMVLVVQSQSRQRTVCSGIWKLGDQTKCLSSFRDQQGDANSSKRAKCFVYKKTVLTFSLPKKGELQTELSANIDYLVHQNTFALNFQCPSFWFCCIRSKAVCPFFFPVWGMWPLKLPLPSLVTLLLCYIKRDLNR